MNKWIYLPQFGANVHPNELPQMLEILIGRRCSNDLIANLDQSKSSVRESPEHMEENLNTLMVALDAIGY